MTKKSLALIGELLIIGALIILAYFVYEIWFSNLSADSRAQQVEVLLEREFSIVSASETINNRVPVPNTGLSALGLLYIPKLSSDVWGTPILNGTGYKALASGVGHYKDSSLPGETGNFAIAGHRATNGEPFAYFEKLAKGDLVIVRTSQGFFTYRLFQDQKIKETEIWVIAERPEGIQTTSTELITLTTCDPRWNSTQRWAWWGELVSFSKQKPQELAK